MVMQPRFRAGFDFMRLRADVGEVEEALAEWWQDFQTADDERRDDLMDQAGKSSGRASAATGPARGAPCAQEGGPCMPRRHRPRQSCPPQMARLMMLLAKSAAAVAASQVARQETPGQHRPQNDCGAGRRRAC